MEGLSAAATTASSTPTATLDELFNGSIFQLPHIGTMGGIGGVSGGVNGHPTSNGHGGNNIILQQLHESGSHDATLDTLLIGAGGHCDDAEAVAAVTFATATRLTEETSSSLSTDPILTGSTAALSNYHINHTSTAMSSTDEDSTAAMSATTATHSPTNDAATTTSTTLSSSTPTAPLTCCICHRTNDNRPMLFFSAVLAPPDSHPSLSTQQQPHDHHDQALLVSTWTMDVAVHIFCGKTAAILPSVNQPEFEVLSKAGLKNKHGIGSHVNGALVRTRHAVYDNKEFYLVREFESNLVAIRHSFLLPGGSDGDDGGGGGNGKHDAHGPLHHGGGGGGGMHNAMVSSSHGLLSPSQQQQPDSETLFMVEESMAMEQQQYDQQTRMLASCGLPLSPPTTVQSLFPLDRVLSEPQQQQQQGIVTSLDPMATGPFLFGGRDLPTGPLPSSPTAHVGALAFLSTTQQQQPQQHHQSTGMLMHNPVLSQEQQKSLPFKFGGSLREKIKCGCGGTHLNPTTPKGIVSWRTHAQTKRHVKYLQNQRSMKVPQSSSMTPNFPFFEEGQR